MVRQRARGPATGGLLRHVAWAAEAKRLKAQGKLPELRQSPSPLLKRPERLTEEQEPRLAGLLKLNLPTVRAYLLKEDFRLPRDCRSPPQANRFI